MSYSRWSTSHWYTFWSASGGKGRDDATFEICAVHSFTAKELREDIDRCLDFVRSLDSTGDLEELRGYMEQFLSDVDNEFPLDIDKNKKRV